MALGGMWGVVIANEGVVRKILESLLILESEAGEASEAADVPWLITLAGYRKSSDSHSIHCV